MMYLVRGVVENGKPQAKFTSWEESYNLLAATRNFQDEKVIFARMYANQKRAWDCFAMLTKIYEEEN